MGLDMIIKYKKNLCILLCVFLRFVGVEHLRISVNIYHFIYNFYAAFSEAILTGTARIICASLEINLMCDEEEEM